MPSMSDWIAFLISEKHPNISVILSMSAVIFSAFAVVMSATDDTLIGGVSAALVATALAIAYLKTVGPYGRLAKGARDLLEDIMSGKERDLSRIEERWGLIERGQKSRSRSHRNPSD